MFKSLSAFPAFPLRLILRNCFLTAPGGFFRNTMDVWGRWKLSQEAENRLKDILLKLDPENPPNPVSKDWLTLLNYDSCPSLGSEMDVDVSPKENDVLDAIKEAMVSNTLIPETLFLGISVNSLSRIFVSVNDFLNEFEFCTFCKNVASWKEDILVEHSLRLVVLHKLKEFTEATGCIIFSIKELVKSKPVKFCENVLIPLLTDHTFQFSDVELLSGVFSALPAAQQDLLILTFTKKIAFLENDWLLLSALLKDLSRNSLLNMLNCIQRFSAKFMESQIFGRFLVNFCKVFDINQGKEILREVVQAHKTLLKVQAMKYLESG